MIENINYIIINFLHLNLMSKDTERVSLPEAYKTTKYLKTIHFYQIKKINKLQDKCITITRQVIS